MAFDRNVKSHLKGRLVVREKKRNKRLSKLEPFILLLPSLIIIIVLVLIPIVQTFSYSTMDYSPIKADEITFIGLDNFKELLQDDKFFMSLRTSTFYSVSVVLFQFVIGLAMALLMKNMKRLKGFYRAAVFAPWAVSGVLTAIIWKMIFNGSVGVANDLLLRLGFIDGAIPWGISGASAFFMVIVASVWRGIPYFAISMLASLTSIPEAMYESAKIDGAGSIGIFFRITLPYLRESIIFTTLLRVIWTFNDVDIVYSLTAGGPNNATLTLPVYITRTAVDYLNFGYGSTLAIGLCLVLMVFSLIYLQLGKSNGDFQA